MTAGFAPRRHYLDLGGGQLHYRSAGDPALPPLVLLHQTPSSSAMYQPLMAELAGHFHLLAPDTPGFGNSDPLAAAATESESAAAEPEIADYARVLGLFLDALDAAPCFLFGHHTGAAIAAQLAHDRPDHVRSLALSGPPLLSAAQKQALPGQAASLPPGADGEHLQAMWQRLRQKDPDAPLALCQREVLSAFACGDAYQASYRAVTRQDFAALLPGIQCRVLAFAGSEDPLAAAVAPTLARLQQGETIALPGGERTYICERQAPLVAAALLNFFLGDGQ